MIHILCVGDVVGKAGRNAVENHLGDLQRRLDIDFTIINVENATHGNGVSEAHCRFFLDQGADVLTTGNHIWDRRQIFPYLDREKRLLRPHNYPRSNPGRGWDVFEDRKGRKIGVGNILGRIGIRGGDDPFQCANQILSPHRLGRDLDAIIIDFHAEATSEKMAMGHFLDGRVSAVFGTHTHVPTADTRILPAGTAFQADIGMTGDYDSVIGMEKIVSVRRFHTGLPERLSPAQGQGTLSGLYIRVDPSRGLACKVQRVTSGATLDQSAPPSD